MADFVKEHKRNTRFSVNRSEKLFFKVSEDELGVWNRLQAVLNERRNTGNKIETFLYLLRKYENRLHTKDRPRNNPYSVDRDKGILFKVNADELALWERCRKNFNAPKVETFLFIIDQEYFFQDQLETIRETDEEIIEEEND